MVLQAAKPSMSKKEHRQGGVGGTLSLPEPPATAKVLESSALNSGEFVRKSALTLKQARSRRQWTGGRALRHGSDCRQPQPLGVPPPLSEFFRRLKPKRRKKRGASRSHNVNAAPGLPPAPEANPQRRILTWHGRGLEGQLSSLPKPEMQLPPKRSADETVAETLDSSAGPQRKSGQAVEEQVAQIKKILDRAPFGDDADRRP